MAPDNAALVPEESVEDEADSALMRNTLAVYPSEPMQFEKECITQDDAALAYYQIYGAQTCEHVFALANILSAQRKPYEAAWVYGLCYRLHSKNRTHYPTPEAIMQLRLLCFLKAGKDLPEHDMQELAALNPAYARYIETMRDTWRGRGERRSTLRHMGSVFEEFMSGEESDRLYLEQAQQVQPSLFKVNTTKEIKPQRIPNKMFLYWEGTPPSDVMENLYFHQGIPDLEVKVFDKEEAAEWLYNFYGKEAQKLFVSLRHGVDAANFFKVHVAHLYGGWWLNATLRLTGEAALEFILQEQNDVVLFLSSESAVNTAFYGTIPQSGFMQDCLLVLYENCYAHQTLFPVFKTGGGIFNRALCRRAYRELEGVELNEAIQFYGTETLHTLVQDARRQEA